MITLPDGSRITHQHIAELAGVGVATVDRVLNQRGGVGAAKAEAVLRVAKELGFDRKIPEVTHRIEILLPHNLTPFWAMLADAFTRLALDLPARFSVIQTPYPENDAPALRDAILNPALPRQGLIIAADAAEGVRPYLERVMSRGERVVTLTTEIPGLSNHVHSGIDNLQAGRTAAYLMKGWIRRTGQVLLMVSQNRRAEHQQRVRGFLEGMDGAAEVVVVWTEGHAQSHAQIVSDALAQGDIVGIYDASHNEPDMAALMRPRPEIVWIGHETSEFHVAMVNEGLMNFILDQDPELQAGFALHALAEEEGSAASTTRAPRPARLRIFCKENL